MDNVGGTVGLIGLAVTVAKILEVLVSWAYRKFLVREKEEESSHGTNGHTPVVRLDPDTSRLMREMHEAALKTAEVTAVRDGDGVPLVYYPRSLGDLQREAVETLREIARSQDKIVDRLEQGLKRN